MASSGLTSVRYAPTIGSRTVKYGSAVKVRDRVSQFQETIAMNL